MLWLCVSGTNVHWDWVLARRKAAANMADFRGDNAHDGWENGYGKMEGK